MSEIEYIVTLKAGVDYDAFNAEMIASTGAGDIPGRSVDIANARPGSKRNTHYALTEAEATALRNDSRVDDVQIPPQDRDDIDIGFNAIQTSSAWRKSTSSGLSEDLNWGLVRGVSKNDPYGSGVATITKDFNYTLTGKGVDVVIQDSGIQVDHPEFTDSAGVSRVNQIDWYAASGLSGTQSVNHYRDYDSHGSHCAGTVAGRTQGWARDAQIYSVKVNGLEGSGDSGTGISVSDCFDVIKLWHRNKPIDPKTGFKRPTVVNASWGYGGNRGTPVGGVFLGNSWTWADYGSSSNNAWANVGVVPVLGLSRRINVRVASVDADLQECLDEGIIFCIAAGNSYYYIDSSTGDHYDDTCNFGSGQEYIFRGSSPYSENAFMVGNIDYTYTNNLEQKAESSCAGPGVNIYAPGTEIISVGSTDNNGTSSLYNTYGGPNSPLDSNYKLMKISGTSMASPQIAGMIACVLEANPGMTPAQVKSYMEANAQDEKINDDATTAEAYNVSVINNGSSEWTASGDDRNGSVAGANDSIAVKVGDTLTIINNADVSHPLYIKDTAGTGTGNQVTTPAAIGQGSYGGNGVQWTPTLPGTYYYQCSNHAGMVGTITVSSDITWDNQDSIWGGPNRYFYSPLWDDSKPWTSNISGNFGI
jgi:subtilisin family serine protease